MSNNPGTQNSDDQNQPIDLAKKLEEAKKQAENQSLEEEKRAHGASAQDERESGFASSSESELIKKIAHGASAQTEDESGSASSDEVELLKKQLEKMTEMAKHTMADLQNLKRRHEEERRLIINMANVDFIRTLIPIVDNLDRAKQHLPEGVSTEWFQGIEICAGQLHKLLEEAGVKPIDSLNQPFNPDLHEALAQGPGPKDTVIEELEKGYTLGDRVIRHAKVKVGDGEQNGSK